MDESPHTRDAIVEHLERVLSSATFQGAARPRALLRFLVEETVQGRSERLKEYTLGAEGLGKGDGFDPRTDPVVRAEVSRLRGRLARYYASAGRTDGIRIDLPKGTYVPQFRSRDLSSTAQPRVVSGARYRGAVLLWFAAGIGGVVLIAAALWVKPHVPLTPSDGGAVMRFDDVLLKHGVLSSDVGVDVILSPDGSRVVFVSQTSDGVSHLNTRRLDQSTALEMTGTEGARGPFFSPDGRWVGFWALGHLKKIAAAGGPPQILCDAPDLLGGSWGDDGNIVAALSRTQLSRLPSSGGSPIVIADLRDESGYPLWPQVLPGSKFVLFTAVGASGPNAATIDLLSLVDGTKRVLARNGTYGRYLENGYLTYINQGTLFAVPFSPDQITVRGTPVPILDDVSYSSTFGFAQVDVSRNGTLVYRKSPGGGQFIVASMAANGSTVPLLARPGHYLWPRLSPDGQRLALSATESGANVIWVHDLRQDRTTRLSSGNYGFPVWTPSGERLVGGGANGLGVIDPRGSLEPHPLVPSDTIQIPWSFSPDGRRLAFYQMSPSNGFDVWTVPVARTATGLTAGTPEPFLQTAAFEVYPAFSPDGRWLAYSSNESGAWEVYVRAFPNGGTSVRVSIAGGRIPIWSSGHHELLYETDQQAIMDVRYTVRDGAFVPEQPTEWSRTRLGDTGVLANFDLSADGNSIVALMSAERPQDLQAQTNASFILNFFEMIRVHTAALPK